MPFRPTKLQLSILQTLDLLENHPVELFSPSWKPIGQAFRFPYGLPDQLLCAATNAHWDVLGPELLPLLKREFVTRTSQYITCMTGGAKRFRSIANHGVVVEWTLPHEVALLNCVAKHSGATDKRPKRSPRAKSSQTKEQPPYVHEWLQPVVFEGSRVRASRPMETLHMSRRIPHVGITKKGLGWLDETDAHWVPDALVTLAQIAPFVGRSKRTMERWLQDELIPKPDVLGGGGKSHRWYWRSIRSDLEKHATRTLPLDFPGSNIVS